MKDFLEMTREEFDKYMCSKYPNQFVERNLPMSETCMCWGFDIGKGWYKILDSLCSKFDAIEKATGIVTTFQQVKEKYGSARFYCHPNAEKSKLDPQDVEKFFDMIYDLEARAEEKSSSTCSECGNYRYYDINVGRWIYDVCPKCFTNIRPEMTEALKSFEIKRELIRLFTDMIWSNCGQERVDKIKEIINPNNGTNG
jgi:hypothetical protein